ncbi:MAG: transposase [Solirubrobacteraceae bacterium]|jgi:transposase|nr:transposase [Solirubrobacteraceae bacterium]MEA2275037.1 transposase [Solirubrobacteraceae bacterium]
MLVVVVAVTASIVEVLPAVSVDGLERLAARCSALVEENEQLWGEVGRLAGENERLRARVGKLRGLLEEARRAGKRQAAPFSRGEPKREPGRPGRRSGEEHGRHGHREPPGEVDETLEAPLEPRCECGGEIEHQRTEYQYQDELPEPRPVRRRFAVHIGKCRCCGRRHQGRHPFQTSDALGAAGCMLGPRAVALATELNKELGLSPQKTAKALARFGLRVTAGGVVGAIARQARALEPTYRALIEGVRASRAVAPDETGWRINGQKAWLWAFAGENVTVYLIAGGRGYEHAAEVLGEGYAGVLERDGWAPYRRFTNAKHQTCHAHLLRRTGELIADSVAGQARVPHAARRILKDALALREQREVIDAEQFGLKVTVLNERTDKLLAMRPTHEPNRRLLAHLQNEREHMFTFLTEPGVQATNWRAEQALRPAIVNRKSWGGNRTPNGARTQQVTMSVIRTARQQNIDPVELLASAQRSRQPAASELIKLPARASPTSLAA